MAFVGVALLAAAACQATLPVPTLTEIGLAPSSTPAITTSTPTVATALPTPEPLITAAPNPPPPSPPPAINSPTPPTPAIIAEGDEVVAFGNLFESEDPPRALLCPLAAGWLGDMGCVGTVFVPVDGVDVRDLPGHEESPHASSVPEHAWITDYLRVEGVLVDGAIEAARVEPSERPSIAEYLESLFPRQAEIPCEPPDGGWPDFDGTNPDGEQAAQALDAEVARNPDEYAGFWFAENTDANGEVIDAAHIVGTVADVESVASRLRAIYPFNLCVVRVEYSGRELQDVVESLTAMNRHWEVQVDASINRVVVRVPVFDRATEEAIQPYANKAVVRAIVAAAEN